MTIFSTNQRWSLNRRGLANVAIVCCCLLTSAALCAEETVEQLPLSVPTAPAEASIGARFIFQQACQGYPKYSFVDTSSGHYDSCSYRFGDGATSDSCDVDHVFSTPGVYEVTLTISGATGDSTFSGRVEVNDRASPLDAAIIVQQEPDRPGDVKFSYRIVGDFSGNVERQTWDFGDGTIVYLPDPEHTYPHAGRFTVSLTLSSCEQQTTFTKIVTVPPTQPLAHATANRAEKPDASPASETTPNPKPDDAEEADDGSVLERTPVPDFRQPPQSAHGVLAAMKVDPKALAMAQGEADHPCLVPGAVLDALERSAALSRYIYHRYLDEEGAYRLAPFQLAPVSTQTDNNDPLASGQETVFFILASDPAESTRSWFLARLTLIEKNRRCHVSIQRKHGTSPSEDATIYQAAQEIKSAWRNYLQRILSLRNADRSVSAQDILPWPDPLMFTPTYLNLLPPVTDRTRLRQGDIALDRQGRIVFAPFSAEYFKNNGKEFFGYRRTDQGWRKVPTKECARLAWYRPVPEFWEDRPAPVVFDAKDTDSDGIHDGMDACPKCAEDYVGQCHTDGCPSKLQLTDVRPHFQAGFVTVAGAQAQSGYAVAGFGMRHPYLSFEIDGAVGVDDGRRAAYGGLALLKVTALSFFERRIQPVLGGLITATSPQAAHDAGDWRLYGGISLGLEGALHRWGVITLTADLSGYLGWERRWGPTYRNDRNEEKRALSNYPDGGAMIGVKIYVD